MLVIVKFVKPNDASYAVKAFNEKGQGKWKKEVEASFWDGTSRVDKCREGKRRMLRKD